MLQLFHVPEHFLECLVLFIIISNVNLFAFLELSQNRLCCDANDVGKGVGGLVG